MADNEVLNTIKALIGHSINQHISLTFESISNENFQLLQLIYIESNHDFNQFYKLFIDTNDFKYSLMSLIGENDPKFEHTNRNGICNIWSYLQMETIFNSVDKADIPLTYNAPGTTWEYNEELRQRAMALYQLLQSNATAYAKEKNHIDKAISLLEWRSVDALDGENYPQSDLLELNVLPALPITFFEDVNGTHNVLRRSSNVQSTLLFSYEEMIYIVNNNKLCYKFRGNHYYIMPYDTLGVSNVNEAFKDLIKKIFIALGGQLIQVEDNSPLAMVIDDEVEANIASSTEGNINKFNY
jgi:hypothetical protein